MELGERIRVIPQNSVTKSLSDTAGKSAEKKNSLERFPGMSGVFNDSLHYITFYITESNANFA